MSRHGVYLSLWMWNTQYILHLLIGDIEFLVKVNEYICMLVSYKIVWINEIFCSVLEKCRFLQQKWKKKLVFIFFAIEQSIFIPIWRRFVQKQNNKLFMMISKQVGYKGINLWGLIKSKTGTCWATPTLYYYSYQSVL